MPMRHLKKAAAAHLHPVTQTTPRHYRKHRIAGLILAVLASLPVVVWSNTALTAGDPAVDTRPDIAGNQENERPVDAETSPAADEHGPAAADAGQAVSVEYDLKLGKAVFNQTCLTCHGTSVRDAPRVGDMHTWQPRLAQGLDVLIRHALEGHGRMPAKGGYGTLTDDEVSAAVAYVYRSGTEILEKQENPYTQAACDPVANPDQCTPEELKRLLVLQMLWLLGGPRQ